MTLTEEAERLETLLAGKAVAAVHRHRKDELVIQFEDGSRLFVNADEPLDISIT